MTKNDIIDRFLIKFWELLMKRKKFPDVSRVFIQIQDLNLNSMNNE